MEHTCSECFGCGIILMVPWEKHLEGSEKGSKEKVYIARKMS